MKIVDAMTLRDGGTTCVSVEEDGVVKHITFDNSLLWEGQIHYVYVSEHHFGQSKAERLEIHSDEEKRVIQMIREAADQQYGEAAVEDYLNNTGENPGEGMWFYVFNFLSIAKYERNNGQI